MRIQETQCRCVERHCVAARFSYSNQKRMEDPMFKAGLALIALAGASFVTPAVAQGVYLDAPGVSVGIGSRPHYGYGWDHPRHRSYGYGVRSYDDDYAYAGQCRTTKIYRGDGSVRTVRRCR
jgi:hypothetical protein